MAVRISNYENPCTHKASDNNPFMSNHAMHCYICYLYIFAAI